MIPPEIVAGFHHLHWVVEWLPRIAQYAGKKYGERKAGQGKELEDRILDYFITVPSSGIDGAWADIILKPIIQDVPFSVAFPVDLTGLAKLKHDMKSLPYETRHRWRMMKRYVPEDKFEQDLKKLVRDNRLDYNMVSQRYTRITR